MKNWLKQQKIRKTQRNAIRLLRKERKRRRKALLHPKKRKEVNPMKAFLKKLLKLLFFLKIPIRILILITELLLRKAKQESLQECEMS